MTRTTLHIGTTKTGSSSIQKFLAQNRTSLQQQGVLYPKALGQIPHNVIPAVIKGGFAATQHQTRYGLTSETDFQTFAKERQHLLANEIAQANPEHIIISSEHMHSRCHTSAHFEQLKQLLSPALEGRDLEIIVYLRPQIEHAISLYSTMLSHGLTQDINTFIKKRMTGPKRRYHDFQELITTWQRAFPNAALNVRAFNAVKTLPEGVITDFIQTASIQPDPAFIYPHRVNAGLNIWSAEAMRLFNTMNMELKGTEKKRIKTWIRQQDAMAKPLPTPSLSQNFQDSFKDSTQWVLQSHLTHIPDALTPNWARLDMYQKAPQISATELRNTFQDILSTSKE